MTEHPGPLPDPHLSDDDIIIGGGRVPGADPPKPATLWSDTVGWAATRSAQILLMAAVFAGTVWLLVKVSVVVIAALVALILAAAVYPVVRWLKSKGWTSLLATAAAFIGILALLGGIITGIVFAVRNEWDSLSSSAVEGWRELENFFRASPLPFDTAAINNAIQQVTEVATSGAFVGSALTGITAATEFIAGVVLMIVILFFFLKDGPKMWNFALRWFHGETRARLAESGDRTIQILGGYVRGTAIIAAVDAVFIGLALALLGVPLALPLAVIVFVGAFLPIIGATIAGILAALVALVTNGLVVALIVIAVVVVVNQMEGDLLQPVVMGRTLSLHAIVVLLALSVGTIVGGIFGAILAVPLTAVAWSVIQVWTDTYQVGHDPVLGEDPVNPKDWVAAKSTMAERWKYQQMRYQERLSRTLHIARGGETAAKEGKAGRKAQPRAEE
ncbi:AI-2E family transporter [Corynebacterium hylobatis]|uniref:AI-2E family transporter n=1 Tax=Corynebacterium hylobatis TaxID=1859290 RepID=A0A3S0B479_9CORY|nr:AI-2E family transporter [Corynebacterium hylobatis]RSZ63202.1 AI-2E family transporter [Corynebacterium hylobatis]